MAKEKWIKGELVIPKKNGEETKEIQFLEIKKEPKGSWKEIKYNKSNKWINNTLNLCHKDLKEKVNLQTKTGATFFYVFKLEDIKYKAEIKVFTITEIRGKNKELIDKELETETRVYKEK